MTPGNHHTLSIESFRQLTERGSPAIKTLELIGHPSPQIDVSNYKPGDPITKLQLDISIGDIESEKLIKPVKKLAFKNSVS